MADNRKYYYLKLKEDFFDTDEMKILESMKDGYLYSNILLKLYLKSLSNSGRLMYRNVIPYTPEILATLTGHQVGTVEKALDVFKKLDLIEMLDNGAIYMMDIQNFIGQSSSEADRQREYYNRMKAEKEALAGESTETPELPEPKEPVLPAEQKSNKAIGNYTTDFEELWEAYPRKVDKGQAYKKYKARLEDGFSHEQLYEAVKNYAAQCKKDVYIKTLDLSKALAENKRLADLEEKLKADKLRKAEEEAERKRQEEIRKQKEAEEQANREAEEAERKAAEAKKAQEAAAEVEQTEPQSEIGKAIESIERSAFSQAIAREAQVAPTEQAVDPFAPKEEPKQEKKYRVRFFADGTKEQLGQLIAFMNENNIKYGKIAKESK